MPPKSEKSSKPFGEILGVGPGGVESYSSDYETASDEQYPNRSAYRSYYDDIYMGYKWQCVEYARRWLYINKGAIFDDVAMAYEIFNLHSLRQVKTNTLLPLRSFRNGSLRHPEPGCLLIWEEGGEFKHTGHVAIITEVFADKVRLAEQNMNFLPWPAGADYSREISAKIGKDGDFWLECSFHDARILGWVIQTDNNQDAEDTSCPEASLFNLQSAEVKPSAKAKKPWLNIANPDEAAYVDMMAGHLLTSVPADFFKYYKASETAAEYLETATDELHGLFMHATDYVLQRPELLEKFGLPAVILPKIRQSWDNRLNQLVTSRFDFSMSEQGLKVYEYNCDSASCYMEVAKVQGKWAQHLGIKSGRDAGANLYDDLVKAWLASEVKGTVHVLQDEDPEETYHALFMKDVIEAAGYNVVHLVGLTDLRSDAYGHIIDNTGERVRWVWKTWAWETAIDQIRAEYEVPENTRAGKFESCVPAGAIPRLVDVLLRADIMVFEPFWTIIPSNKAILPILWSLFPNHPFLLNTQFELTEELSASGYVVKPIVGRCGANIQLINTNAEVIAAKDGKFGLRNNIYQALFPLPKLGEYYVQISTFTAAGQYAGAGIRVDKTMIIGNQSNCMALRFEGDEVLNQPVIE